MDTQDTYYTDLITRYLSGEASQEEIAELSAWIQSSPEKASLFTSFRKTWLGVAADQVEQQIDTEKEWESLMPKLSGLKAQSTEHRSEDTEPKVIEMETGRLPWQVVLIRASLIAAIVLVLLIPTWVGYRYFTRTEMLRLTASNELLEAQLPDGTTVTLNTFATLTYSEDFGKTNREVILHGKAYFEVKRDSLLPFVISSGTSRLEVLGTSFYVEADMEAGNMGVVLVEGSVAVYFDEARSTGKTIIPGEKAELIQASQQIIVLPNDDPNFLAWKTHQLIFLDDRLDMVIQTLNRVYQTNISLANENLAGCRLTTIFNQQSLESVLSVIQATLDLRAETTPSGIILYGEGCN